MAFTQDIKLLRFFLNTMLDCCNSIPNNDWARFFVTQVERMYQLNQLTVSQKKAICGLAHAIGANNSKEVAIEQIQRICFAVSGVTDNANVTVLQETLQNAIAFSVIGKEVMHYIMTFFGSEKNTSKKPTVKMQTFVKKSVANKTVVTTDNIRQVAERLYRLIYKEHKDIVVCCKNSASDGCSGSRSFLYKKFEDIMTEEMTYGFHAHDVESIHERTRNPHYDGCSNSREYEFSKLYTISDSLFGCLCGKVSELIEEEIKQTSFIPAQMTQNTVNPCLSGGIRNRC